MKLLSYRKAKTSETMECLHGIRAISTQWIVLGHSFAIYSMLPVQNLSALPTVDEIITIYLNCKSN